jgi:outer membrane protein TolC
MLSPSRCAGVVAFAAAVAWASLGEAQQPRAMTLAQALAYARAHQPAVRAAEARVEASRAEASVPGAQWEPTIGVTAQIFGMTANNTTGSYLAPAHIDVLRIGGTRVTSTGSLQPYAATFVAGSVTQELFDFGRIAAQTAAADAAVDVERQRARAQVLDVTYDVEEAYFAVYAAKSIVRASDDAYERARVQRDFAKAGVDAQLRRPIELTRAEADLSRFDVGRVQARGGLSKAQTVFAAAVGVPDAQLDVSGEAQGPADMPALADAIQRASARDPRIQALFARLKAEEARTRAIGAERRPDIFLTGTVSGRAGGAPPSAGGDPAVGNGWVPNVPNWDVGAVFSWPIFEPTVTARANAARAREQATREEITALRHDEVAAIQEAYAEVEVARAALPALQRAVDAARANYAQAEAHFRAEVGTSVELADAEALLTDAEIRLALGQFELARARANFGRTIAEGM